MDLKQGYATVVEQIPRPRKTLSQHPEPPKPRRISLTTGTSLFLCASRLSQHSTAKMPSFSRMWSAPGVVMRCVGVCLGGGGRGGNSRESVLSLSPCPKPQPPTMQLPLLYHHHTPKTLEPPPKPTHYAPPTLTCPEALLATDGALAGIHQVSKELPASGCLKEGQVHGLGHTVQRSTSGHGTGYTLQSHAVRVRESDM